MRCLSSAILLTLVGLSACAAAPQPYPVDTQARLAAYAAAAPCCDDPAGFDYAALPAAGNLDVVVGTASPVFEFHSGLSPLAAFRLPDTDLPYRVRVKSYFDGEGVDGSVFYPVLAMLDDAYIVTRMSNLDGLKLDQALATPGGETGLAVTAPFHPRFSRERYLVVFTPAVLLGAAPERRDGDTQTLPTLDWLERRGDAVVAPSPFGRLRITVAPEALPDAGPAPADPAPAG